MAPAGSAVVILDLVLQHPNALPGAMFERINVIAA
jgi:hypothetical protein